MVRLMVFNPLSDDRISRNLWNKHGTFLLRTSPWQELCCPIEQVSLPSKRRLAVRKHGTSVPLPPTRPNPTVLVR